MSDNGRKMRLMMYRVCGVTGGIGALFMSICHHRGGPKELFYAGAVMLAGALSAAGATAALEPAIDRLAKPSEDLYEAGYETGIAQGYAEGRRAGRLVVAQFPEAGNG